MSSALAATLEPGQLSPALETARDPGQQSPAHVAVLNPGLLQLSTALAAALDPGQLQLSVSAGRGSRITKESFERRDGGLGTRAADPLDPLSSLDPLWSCKKT